MSQRIWRIILIGGLTVAVGVAFWGVALAAPAGQGGTPTPGSSAPTTDIGVSGTGSVFANPDTAIASLGVDITGTTLTAASADASKRMTAVLDKVKSLGVDSKDITTVSYNVNPITSNPKEGETPQITGYHVSNIVQIKIRKLNDVGTILDAAVAAGANSINNIYFTIDDPTPFGQQARQKAVAAAQAKAKTLAEAAGVRLGPLVSIGENVSRPLPVFDRMYALPSAAAGAGAPGPIESGQMEVSVTVEVHYQIAQ